MPMGGGRGAPRGGGHRMGGRAGGRFGAARGPQFDDALIGDADDFESEDGEELDDEDGFNEEFDDSSDEEAANDELVQSVALPVTGGPLPPSDEPPKDADEYLRQVQWERMHLAETVDADVVEKPPRRRKQQNNRTSLLTKFEVPEVPEHLRHCPEWAEDVVAAFLDLRARCEEAREEADEASDEALTAESWRERLRGRPSTALLAAQDVVSLHLLLVTVVDSVLEVQEANRAAAADEVAVADDSASTASPFGSHSFLAEWAFAVLAFVEEPLVDDVQYNLQRLRRACQKAILSAHTQAAAGGGAFDMCAHSQATLLLVVITEHFGQR